MSVETPSRHAMMTFARDWVAAWNRRDVEAVLTHFADDAVFVSPLAEKYAGSSVIHGKAALARYWRLALERLSLLEFTLEYASWDSEQRELNVVYVSDLNGTRRRTCETMKFDAAGRQIRGEAFYGAEL